MPTALRNAEIRAELALLQREGRLAPDQMSRILELYPSGRLDPVRLVRWLTILGALTLASGIVVWLREVVSWTLAVTTWVVGAGTFALGALAWYLRRRRGLERAGLAVELLACLALTAETGLLAALVFGAQGNWPILFGLESVVLFALAYALVNPLTLVAAIVVVLFWAGAQTGYVSEWQGYYVGMNYPLRFVALAAAGVLVGAVHLRTKSAALARYRGFGRMWSIAALVVGNLALWLLSIWGNAGDWELELGGGAGELLLYNLIWAAASGVEILAGARTGHRWMTACGVTFLVIQVYTLFFQHVAGEVGWFGSTILVGASLIGLGVWLERRLAARRKGPNVAAKVLT